MNIEKLSPALMVRIAFVAWIIFLGIYAVSLTSIFWRANRTSFVLVPMPILVEQAPCGLLPEAGSR